MTFRRYEVVLLQVPQACMQGRRDQIGQAGQAWVLGPTNLSFDSLAGRCLAGL